MSEKIEKLINIDLSRFGAYSPCKSPEVMAAKLGLKPSQIIKLDANENPYGCSPRALAAVSTRVDFSIYPDADHSELRRVIAYAGCRPENIVAGNGSDEIIDLLLRLFLSPGDEVIIPVPTFDMYRFCTQLCSGKVVEVRLTPDFRLDVAAIKAAITKKTKVIFITNPNNPTGTLTGREDILSIADTGLPVIVDEAYFEFSRMTVMDEVFRRENLFVLRTFSKWAGLAGLRVGYGILPENIACYIMKIKPPYNVNLAASAAVQASIEDKVYLTDTISKIIEERERLFAALSRLSFLKPVPSRANFILCEVLKGQANLIREELENRGILIRYYNTALLKNYIRISVGKPEHTDIIIPVLKEIGEKTNG